MRAAVAALAACSLLAAGCGGDETKTVTVNRPALPAGTTPATGTLPTELDEVAIISTVEAWYAAKGVRVPRSELKIVRTNGLFADVLVSGEAHAILKRGAAGWLVVFDGNGAVPMETRREFGIPPEYGG